MKGSLLILIATVVLAVECLGGSLTLREPFACIENITDIDCEAVHLEYDTEKKHCQKMFPPCSAELSSCNVSVFCSEECRNIYQMVLRCKNDTNKSSKLDLYCSDSGDPQRPTCLDVLLHRKVEGEGYGYRTPCSFDEITNLQSPYSESCKKSLMSYKNDCCSINLSIEDVILAGQNNDNLISFHSHRLWEHCQVKSPKICPFPSCTTSKHHVNSTCHMMMRHLDYQYIT